jgi:hypothetical protein
MPTNPDGHAFDELQVSIGRRVQRPARTRLQRVSGHTTCSPPGVLERFVAPRIWSARESMKASNGTRIVWYQQQCRKR